MHTLTAKMVGCLLLSSALLATSSALAAPKSATQNATGKALPTTVRGKGVLAVTKLRGTDAQITRTPAFIPLSTATTTIVVPTGKRAIIDASFTAESACYPINAAQPVGYCSVRILLDGAEMAPVVGTDFAFDSSNAGNQGPLSWEAHAMDRSSRGAVGQGVHTVQVQWGVVGGAAGNTEFRLDDWHLFVDAVEAP
ncbi:MAG TPA: hypothetical protein V6D19_06350 [Stenomitos sp.]